MKNSITLLASCLFYIFNISAQELPCTASPTLSSDWQLLGPYEYEESKQGKIIAVWAEPSNINTVYAGTGSSGLWKTTDGGVNWQNLFSYQLAGVGVQEIEEAEVFFRSRIVSLAQLGDVAEVNALYFIEVFIISNYIFIIYC
ncbi:MAG: hypothetical protein IPN31_13940 [Bacteroidetes bacterium]|nr:hypothetical protein [Bacteroidota bacterium]